MKRRDFLATCGGAVLSAPMIFSKSRAFAQTLSTISIAKHGLASTTSGSTPNMVSMRWAVNMIVDKMILQMTGATTVARAWESLFPGLTTQSKIAIKVNHSYDIYNNYNAKQTPRTCPWGQKAVISEAIIGGLTQMLGGTFPIENITVFDKQVDAYVSTNNFALSAAIGMTWQGYPGSMTDVETAGYSVSGPGLYNVVLVNHWNPDVIAGMPTFDAGTSQLVTQVVLPPIKNSNYWINVAIPKDHSGAQGAGYTGMLKNCYGATNNCGGTHPRGNTTLIHECIPDFYTALTAITPCVLNFLDALAGVLDGGPGFGPGFYPNTVACSTDPLTMEYYGLELVNAARRNAGYHDIGVISGRNQDNHPNAYSLTLAQGPKYSLGNYNAGNRISADLSAGIKGPQPMASLDAAHGRIDALMRAGAGWRLHLSLDASGRTHTVQSSILDVRGRVVRSLGDVRTPLSSADLSWDGSNNRGGTVAPGIYTWQVRIDGRVSHQSVFVS